MNSAIKIVLFNLVLLSALSLHAQEDDLFVKVEDALESSSSKELAKYLYSKVELKLDGKRQEYSDKQAEAILKKFFQENSAVNCEFIHLGNNAGRIIYAIGKYETSSNNFRVVVRAKKFDSEYKLYRIEFTKE